MEIIDIQIKTVNNEIYYIHYLRQSTDIQKLRYSFCYDIFNSSFQMLGCESTRQVFCDIGRGRERVGREGGIMGADD